MSKHRPDPTTGQASSLDARDDWLWIADRWTRLRNRLRPGGGNALTGAVATSGEAPLPIDVVVSDLLATIDGAVRGYAQQLLAEVPVEHGCAGVCHGALEHECPDGCHQVAVHPEACPSRVDPITTSAMPALLVQVARRHGHWTGDAGTQFATDANTLRHKVRRTLERPAPPTYLGPCPPREDGTWCGGELYLGERKLSGKCRVCGAPFTLAERMEWLEAKLETRLMTSSELARALKILATPVPFPTIRQWVQRRRLVEVVPGSGLYRLADAKALAERPRTRRTAA